ncbi:MAG: hypothetical protein P1V97_11160 [Planctomycetota bacterium]|nr:hypothetical protein [Planctomycetota bacterium]
MTQSNHWPWYAFIYRFGGPQVTFWLWILSLLGVWLFFQDAAMTILNRKPQVRSVADASSGQMYWQSWVMVEGTEIKNVRKLLGRKGESSIPLRILLDPSDPAAIYWRGLAKLAADLGPKPDSDSEKGMEFQSILTTFNKDRDKKYIPWRAMILYEDSDTAPISSETNLAEPLTPSEVTDDMGPLALEELKFQKRVALVRENITSTEKYQGVLDIHSQLAINVSNQSLRIGRKPSKSSLIIFTLSFMILLMLLAGLQGAIKRDAALSEASALREKLRSESPT